MAEIVMSDENFEKLLKILGKGDLTVSTKLDGKSGIMFVLKSEGFKESRHHPCDAIRGLYDRVFPDEEIVVNGVTYVRKA